MAPGILKDTQLLKHQQGPLKHFRMLTSLQAPFVEESHTIPPPPLRQLSILVLQLL